VRTSPRSPRVQDCSSPVPRARRQSPTSPPHPAREGERFYKITVVPTTVREVVYDKLSSGSGCVCSSTKTFEKCSPTVTRRGWQQLMEGSPTRTSARVQGPSVQIHLVRETRRSTAPGCVDPRQAHRGDRSADAAPVTIIIRVHGIPARLADRPCGFERRTVDVRGRRARGRPSV